MKSLSQMTEEELKTLCKYLEERYGENSTVTLKQSDFNNMWASIDRYAKENKCLQEQLKEANKLIKWVVKTSWTGNQEEDDFDRYCDKWGVK